MHPKKYDSLVLPLFYFETCHIDELYRLTNKYCSLYKIVKLFLLINKIAIELS